MDKSCAPTQHKAHGPHEPVSQMTKDPVCGMSVDPQQAAVSQLRGGKTYYFCSAHCAEMFRADPDRLLADEKDLPQVRQPSQKPAGPVRSEGYTCPMHPEVRQQEPGACPKCGMALEPVSPKAPATKIEYTCPMHPEIVRRPGHPIA